MFTLRHTRRQVLRLTAASAAALLIGSAPAISQGYKPSNFSLSSGDAVVTGFSGVRSNGAGAEAMFIDTEAASMRILRASRTGAAPIPADVTFEVAASEVGQVFPIALGRRGTRGADIYLGATSLFGLQIVLPDSDGDGIPERTQKGHLDADWMQGQFGEGGGAGSVYKVDGDTGAVSLFAEIEGNSGAGIGDIVHDARTGNLYVSDLDTGLVHRIDRTGRITGSYDHGREALPAFGVEPVADDGKWANIKTSSFDADDPETWGLTQSARRVWGMALRDGRLFYSVADGAEIWSVRLNADGSFSTDIRPEIDIDRVEDRLPVTDMVFGADGSLYAAQRGFMTGGYEYRIFADNQEAKVLRFVRDDGAAAENASPWRLVDPDVTGALPEPLLLSGGIDLERCEAGLWTTGDAEAGQDLPAAPGEPLIYPLGGSAGGLSKVADRDAATLVTFNNAIAAGTGDVEILRDCTPVATPVVAPVHGPASSHWRAASRGPGLVPVHNSAASHSKHGSFGHSTLRSHWRYASNDGGHSVRRSHWKRASPGGHSRLRSHWKWASPGDGHSLRRSHWKKASPGGQHSRLRSHWKHASPGHSVRRSHLKKASPGGHTRLRSHWKKASPVGQHTRLRSHWKKASPVGQHTRLRSHWKKASPVVQHTRMRSHWKKASPVVQHNRLASHRKVGSRVAFGGNGVKNPQVTHHRRAISRAVRNEPRIRIRPSDFRPKRFEAKPVFTRPGARVKPQ